MKRLPFLEKPPLGLKLKLGKYRPDIGKNNRIHFHDLMWTTRPLPVAKFLGTEGLGESAEGGFQAAGLDADFMLPLGGSNTSVRMVAGYAATLKGTMWRIEKRKAEVRRNTWSSLLFILLWLLPLTVLFLLPPWRLGLKGRVQVPGEESFIKPWMIDSGRSLCARHHPGPYLTGLATQVVTGHASMDHLEGFS